MRRVTVIENSIPISGKNTQKGRVFLIKMPKIMLILHKIMGNYISTKSKNIHKIRVFFFNF